ncbi:hypothetical protein U1Q18_017378, partial [Sarracenia purpurea var. burkii]
MQAALYLSPSSFPTLTPTKPIASPWRSCSTPPLQSTNSLPLIKLAATPSDDNSTVDYSTITSVFPAEACETVGGAACDVEMYPEVKLNPDTKNNTTRKATEMVDREYLEYNTPKT